MIVLTDQQVKQYNDQGYISPIDALTKEEVTTVRKEIEFIEKQMPNEIDKSGRYNVHLISPKLDEIVHHSKILDAVESVIGKNTGDDFNEQKITLPIIHSMSNASNNEKLLLTEIFEKGRSKTGHFFLSVFY